MLKAVLQKLDRHARGVSSTSYGLPIGDSTFDYLAKEAAKEFQVASNPGIASNNFLEAINSAARQDPDYGLPMDTSNIVEMKKIVITGLAMSKDARMLRLFNAFDIDTASSPVLMNLEGVFETQLSDLGRIGKVPEVTKEDIASMKSRLESVDQAGIMPDGINASLRSHLKLANTTNTQIQYLNCVLPGGISYLTNLIGNDQEQTAELSKGVKSMAITLASHNGIHPFLEIWGMSQSSADKNLLKEVCTVGAYADQKLLQLGFDAGYTKNPEASRYSHFNAAFVDMENAIDFLDQLKIPESEKKELQGVYAFCSFTMQSDPAQAKGTLTDYLKNLSEEDLINNKHLKLMLLENPKHAEPFLSGASEVVFSSAIDLD